MNLVLATTSPYRLEIMELLGIPFESRASNVDEYNCERPNDPILLVKYLSGLKAEAVAKYYKNSLVIGLDSAGYFNGEILEKPKCLEEGFERLEKLSGNLHRFYTGITVINTNNSRDYKDYVMTSIEFRGISNLEIKKYLEEDSKFNTYALGYDPINHISTTFIKNVNGDLNNFLRGFPLMKIFEMIAEAEK